MINPWNTKMLTEFDANLMGPLIDWYNRVISTPTHRRAKYIADNQPPQKSVDYLIHLYYNAGYGGEVLRRELGLTKTRWRTFFTSYLSLQLRVRGDITDRQRQFRSERVSGDKNPFHDWTTKHPDMQLNKNWRGVQGWYTRTDNSRIFLRSTWEYIYAKWLDANNIIWTFEERIYDLSNGERYKPDFFIYSPDGSLSHIVEVKGFHKKWLYKAKLFEEDYKIKTVIVDNIESYSDFSYYKEKDIWKKLQK